MTISLMEKPNLFYNLPPNVFKWIENNEENRAKYLEYTNQELEELKTEAIKQEEFEIAAFFRDVLIDKKNISIDLTQNNTSQQLTKVISEGNLNKNEWIALKWDYKWEEIKKNCPSPYYIKPGSIIEVTAYNNGKIEASWYCLFPGDDETLKKREQANHIHYLEVDDKAKRALGTVWNAARASKEIAGWTVMKSVRTYTDAPDSLMKDKPYKFHATLEPIKGPFKKVTLKIDVGNGKLCTVESLVYVK